MPRTSQYVKVGKRSIELSNLNKILYPDDHIIKAELIEYYFRIAPTILSHIKGRPLSLVRFPDGIDGGMFFQKNRPEWAPQWIESIALGTEEKKDYVLATEEASLVWLANLACIELHQMHSRAPHYDKPDYMVFDFDPPDDFGFPNVAKLAIEFRQHLESFGYHAFVKTTGRKGLHVVAPLHQRWSFDEVFEAAKLVAQPFVDKNGEMTLHIKKESRKGRVLLDIYRNRQSQTIVSSYSARGLPGATVSMPLRWDDLASLKDLREWNIRTVPDAVLQTGDVWQTIDAYATELHTHRKTVVAAKKPVKPARTYKTPEQLKSYEEKRRFERTPEPKPLALEGEGNLFVVHRHHASRLHYDLRLEHEGVLKSWAVPKGLPPRPGVMRLAVAVEEHPLEYVNFEGDIPKGEYGGGRMWIFARGRYTITKEKKKGFYFRLSSVGITGEYRMHETKDNQWLIERVDTPQIDWLQTAIEPMLAQSEAKPPAGDYLYEVKWDGIRALVTIDEGAVRILTRNHKDITAGFPELLAPEEAFRVSGAVFDAEIVCLDSVGKPVFKDVIHRMQQSGEHSIKRALEKNPAHCYLFDVLYLDGRSVMNEPLIRRREWLADVLKPGTAYRLSETVEDGDALFAAASSMGLEGIIAKERLSTYQPGKRTNTWLKIKSRHTMDCVIIGYTEGKGDRATTFVALQIAVSEGKSLRYLGKVGSGFDTKLLKEIFSQLKRLRSIERPIKEKPLDDKLTTWIEPLLWCEVQYASFTKDGMLREPVFVRMRPDR